MILLNNVEVLKDFKRVLKEISPTIQLSQREETLLRMAINHTFLCMTDDGDKNSNTTEQ